MDPDGRGRDPELLGHLVAGVPGRQQLDDLLLAR
jgi:hypothetical protein